jgi:DUF4097 and DUF4098 domain-containing protein YvlB
LLAAVLALGALQQTDTTFAVSANARLEVNNMGGEVMIDTWNRNEMRIQADHSSQVRVDIDQSGSVVQVRARARHGPATAVDYRITVPTSMAVDVNGTFTDIDIDGVRADINARTVQGDVRVRGGQGRVTLRSVQGFVELSGASGRIDVKSVSDDVRVDGVTGDVIAEAVSGDVLLRGVDSRSVSLNSVSGDLLYDGVIHGDGRYTMTTHSGDIELFVPDDLDATVSVGTMSGDIETEFQVRLPAGRNDRRRFTFTLGNGGATLELETFSGDIELSRRR